jgi:putative PIN family toxin of toxin-antitoxin system
MRAVLDTNVLVAGFRSRRGASFAVLTKAARRTFEMLASTSLFLEYEEVLKRPEHRIENGLSIDDVDRALRGLAAIIEPVEVRFLWRPQTRDPNDEMVLEAAVNGRADRLVTFNAKDFAPAATFGLSVVTPQVFLKEIGG